jgi:hypothetical protein
VQVAVRVTESVELVAPMQSVVMRWTVTVLVVVLPCVGVTAGSVSVGETPVDDESVPVPELTVQA